MGQGESSKTPVLATPRVLLRQFTEADADHLFQLDHDPGVLAHTSETPGEVVESYRNLIRETYLPFYARYAHFGFWAAEDRADGRFLGWFCLHPGSEAGEAAGLLGFEPGDVELGYRLRRFAWGRGYATEVVLGLIAWAIGELGVAQVVAVTSAANLASIRVLTRAGLRREAQSYSLPWSATPFVKFTQSREQWLAHADRKPPGNDQR